jgi:cytochrome c5
MRRLALLVAALGLAACGPGLPTATPGDAARANVQLADLQQGRQLTVSKCSSCHAAPMPTEHKAAEWPHALDEMAERSHLDAQEHHLIEAYLVTMAGSSPVASR